MTRLAKVLREGVPGNSPVCWEGSHDVDQYFGSSVDFELATREQVLDSMSPFGEDFEDSLPEGMTHVVILR